MSNLNTSYKFFRMTGLPPASALQLARVDVLKDKERYLPIVTGWNPASENGARFIESVEGAGLRLVGYADKIARMGHKGWYCDTLESDVYRGVVFMLPGKNRLNRYLAGYENPHNPGTYRIDMARGIFEGLGSDYYPSNRHGDNAVRDAARAADDFAEKEAKSAREYDEVWQNGSQYAGQGEIVSDARKEALALIREIKAHGEFSPAICSTLRGKLNDLRHSIKEAREKRAKLKGDPNSWFFREGLHHAFNDGAGEVVFTA